MIISLPSYSINSKFQPVYIHICLYVTGLLTWIVWPWKPEEGTSLVGSLIPHCTYLFGCVCVCVCVCVCMVTCMCVLYNFSYPACTKPYPYCHCVSSYTSPCHVWFEDKYKYWLKALGFLVYLCVQSMGI